MPSSARCRRPPTPHRHRHTPRSVGTHNAPKPPPTSASPVPLNTRDSLPATDRHQRLDHHSAATHVSQRHFYDTPCSAVARSQYQQRPKHVQVHEIYAYSTHHSIK